MPDRFLCHWSRLQWVELKEHYIFLIAIDTCLLKAK